MPSAGVTPGEKLWMGLVRSASRQGHHLSKVALLGALAVVTTEQLATTFLPDLISAK